MDLPKTFAEKKAGHLPYRGTPGVLLATAVSQQFTAISYFLKAVFTQLHYIFERPLLPSCLGVSLLLLTRFYCPDNFPCVPYKAKELMLSNRGAGEDS